MKYFSFSLSVFLLSTCLFVQAQTAITFTGANNVEALITNRGALFSDGNSSRFRVPKTSNQSTIYASSPWIGGMSNGNLYLAAETYRQAGRDIQQGPVQSSYPAGFLTYWDRIWKVSAVDIQAFRDTISQGGTPDPFDFKDILEWPATANVWGDDSTTAYAPFVDVNHDNKYTPLQGDYPLIKGDLATFCIMNDDVLHTETSSMPLQVEIQRMTYQYQTSDAINNTVFVNYKIINRSIRTYDELIVSNWTDFDLGYYTDDYVGTNTSLDYVYAFNGDANDETIMGYGTTPPAQACVMLNKTLWASMYYQNDFSNRGNPTVAEHYYNYMKGLWMDGQQKVAAGTGRDTIGPVTRFSYEGDPCANTGWWEGSANNVPGDRRMLASTAPQTLLPGGVIDLDIAFVYNRASSGDNIASVCGLDDAVTTVRDFYSTNTAVSKTAADNFTFSVYPNPTATDINLRLVAHKTGTLTVTNLTGKMILQQRTNGQTEFQLAKLPAGIYAISIQTDAGNAIRKVVVVD